METTQPVRIQIAKDKHGEWTIEPKDVEGNKKRFKDQYKQRFDDRWAERNGKKRDEDHYPIIFLEGDVLRFECAVAFEIGAKKNPDLAKVLAAPDNPFGWSKEQKSDKAGSSIDATVLKGEGVKLQAFYKFYGWVIVDGQRISVDPDGYCGG